MASAAQMTFLGIWSCQWRELRPINFGGGANSNSNNNSSSSNSINPNNHQGDEMSGEDRSGDFGGEQVDEELGYGRGRKKSRLLGLQLGRSRDRDGVGEYELVAMKEGGDG